jgi:hypothetical protein
MPLNLAMIVPHLVASITAAIRSHNIHGGNNEAQLR